jgi:UDP-N-acetylmuramoyl-tripeptide--D-alanyl-D-alanine ligase
VENALAAAALTRHIGLTWEEIKTGLAKMKLTRMRLEFIKMDNRNIQIINDAYNANPDSMASALEVQKEAAGERRTLAILGDMYELGDYTEVGHLTVGRKAKEKDLAYLITVGKLGAVIARGALEAGMEREKIRTCENNEEAIKTIQPLMRDGDVILVKGSRGVKMEEIIAGMLV